MAEEKQVRAVKMSEKYHLSKGDKYHMEVEVIRGPSNQGKRLRVMNGQSRDSAFHFNPSKPETVKAIAELLLRAAKL